MDLRALIIFIEVAELRSFTKAGEHLGYSQPTISFQIKQLEEELGVPLFDRIGHTVDLTDAGREALHYAQRICNLSQEMTLDARHLREPQGIVRIGMPDSLCVPLIVREFATFRRAYPGIQAHIFNAGTDELLRMLDHNEVDLICSMDNHVYDATYIIANEEAVGVHFVAAASNPLAERKQLTLQELAEQPFLLTERGMSYRRLMDEKLAQLSLQVQPILETARADVICGLVENDIGIGFLPDYVTETAVQEGKLKRLDVADFRAEVWKQILYRREKWLSPPMRAMIDHLSKLPLQG